MAPVPPVAITSAVPSHTPAPVASPVDTIEVATGAGSVIVVEKDEVHPFTSVTSTAYVPAHSPVTSGVP